MKRYSSEKKKIYPREYSDSLQQGQISEENPLQISSGYSLTDSSKNPKYSKKKEKIKKSMKDNFLEHFKCQWCERTYKAERNLKIHLAFHEKKGIFICCHCGETLSSGPELQKHLKLHSDGCTLIPDDSKEKCSIKTTKLDSAKKPFICTLCKKRYTLESFLKEHMKIHVTKHVYSCSVCHKSFPHDCKLKKHMMTHIQSYKIFQCSLCGKCFSSSKYRKKHLIKKHRLSSHDLSKLDNHKRRSVPNANGNKQEGSRKCHKEKAAAVVKQEENIKQEYRYSDTVSMKEEVEDIDTLDSQFTYNLYNHNKEISIKEEAIVKQDESIEEEAILKQDQPIKEENFSVTSEDNDNYNSVPEPSCLCNFIMVDQIEAPDVEETSSDPLAF